MSGERCRSSGPTAEWEKENVGDASDTMDKTRSSADSVTPWVVTKQPHPSTIVLCSDFDVTNEAMIEEIVGRAEMYGRLLDFRLSLLSHAHSQPRVHRKKRQTPTAATAVTASVVSEQQSNSVADRHRRSSRELTPPTLDRDVPESLTANTGQPDQSDGNSAVLALKFSSIEDAALARMRLHQYAFHSKAQPSLSSTTQDSDSTSSSHAPTLADLAHAADGVPSVGDTIIDTAFGDILSDHDASSMQNATRVHHDTATNNKSIPGRTRRRTHLTVPATEKLFLISPPASPPDGWVQHAEDPPVVNHRLVDALMSLEPNVPHVLVDKTDKTPMICVTDHSTSGADASCNDRASGRPSICVDDMEVDPSQLAVDTNPRFAQLDATVEGGGIVSIHTRRPPLDASGRRGISAGNTYTP